MTDAPPFGEDDVMDSEPTNAFTYGTDVGEELSMEMDFEMAGPDSPMPDVPEPEQPAEEDSPMPDRQNIRIVLKRPAQVEVPVETEDVRWEFVMPRRRRPVVENYAPTPMETTQSACSSIGSVPRPSQS